jgi:hypothetical protein
MDENINSNSKLTPTDLLGASLTPKESKEDERPVLVFEGRAGRDQQPRSGSMKRGRKALDKQMVDGCLKKLSMAQFVEMSLSKGWQELAQNKVIEAYLVSRKFDLEELRYRVITL